MGLGFVGTAVLVLSLAPAAALGQAASLDEVLDPVGELRLEETTERLVVQPHMVPDPTGGWLYWDSRAQDVRLFDRDGGLRAAFGREGDGPGEFQRPVGVTRMPDGRLVVLDGRGISVWTPGGDSLLVDIASGLLRPRGIASIGSHQVAIMVAPTASENGSPPLLHHFDLAQRSVVRSYFRLELKDLDRTAALSVQGPPPMSVADSLALVLPPFDSIWVVPVGGEGVTRRLPISATAVRSSPSTEALSAGSAAFRPWIYESTFAGRTYRLRDGGWLVQTWGLRQDGPFRGLARLDPTGSLVWEVDRTPELLAVDPATGEILLWDPEGLDPGRVQVVRERQPVLPN